MRERSYDGSTDLAQPANSGARDAARGLERRRPRPVDQSPIEVLRQTPSLVVLERLPEPALAVDRDGTILFANGAFCDMLGHAPDKLLAMKFRDIFDAPATHQCAVDLIHAHRDRLVTLVHKDGHPVRARMSKSAMQRRDDRFALVIIQDHTEELWLNS
jgi:PAS domain S-box-containing protein